ncbi:hypothetical protein ACN47E_008884 [Coniothyrium glycines]
MPDSPLPSDPENSAGQKKNGTPGKKKGAPARDSAMNGNEFAKAIGINRPANVRDKIKRWQQDVEPDTPAGASTAAPAPAPAPAPMPAAPAAVPAPAPAPDSPKPAAALKLPATLNIKAVDDKPDWKPGHTPTKSVDVSPERPESAKKVPVVHNPLDDDLQNATAPKKRVVSDSHWRNRQSPPKDIGRPAPKVIANAWVRPSRIVKLEKPMIPKPKPPPPAPPPLDPLLPLINYVGKSTGQTKPSLKERRPSKPSSSDNERPPASSGSGDGKEATSDVVEDDPPSPKLPKDKTDLVKVRRRRRAQTSPRASLSADEFTPFTHRTARKSETSLSEDPANIVTVAYEPSSIITSPRDEEIRERRRRRRPRSQGDRTADEAPREAPRPSRRRSRRSYPRTEEEAAATLPLKPETPPKALGNRLEAWLSATPDPFVDANDRRRRKSRDLAAAATEVSSTDASKTDITASTETLDESTDKTSRRSSGSGSGSGSRRRRRRRSRELKREADLKIDTEIADETTSVITSTITSTIISDATTEISTQEKDSEVSLTPTPTLKRRGARRSQHSPTKSRSMSSPLREATSADDLQGDQNNDVDAESSAPSSSVDTSVVEIEKVAPLRSRPLRGPRPLTVQRAIPSRGKRLSTIASVETFATKPSGATTSDLDVLSEEASTGVGTLLNPETSTIISRRSTRRKRLASHADLISVLSMPKAVGTKSIVSARSIRTNRSRLATATVSDIMKELTNDETKYMRELRTLVDGVIPVLLSCVLSKSDSAVAAGLFSRSKTDPNEVTKPIVNMGVCLERLKTLHKRVPKEDANALVSWAQSAQRVYADYIAAWCLGFQDVVISLAPADHDPFKPAKIVNGPENGDPWDGGMPQNAEGYVVNGDGERVDVAYILKRPLVRLKYLAKSLKGINHLRPKEETEQISIAFQDLVAAARKRSNDEQARLEDEAASNIDPTRARDPRSLAPLAGVSIDATRNVRARDHFDMHLYHSSGQEISCRIEILLRDDPPHTGNSGDLLFCEVDPTGRWLLLPPIQQNRVSARNGDVEGEIIVMIRGTQNDGAAWSEVMSLITEDEQAGFDWVQMLGLQPVPPSVDEIRKSHNVPNDTVRPASSHASSSLLSAVTASTLPQKSRTPSPREIEIPIGEQHTEVSKVWHYDTVRRREQSRNLSPVTSPSVENSQIEYAQYAGELSPPAQHQPSHDPQRTPRSLNEAIQIAESSSPLGLKRTRAKRINRNEASSPTASRPSRQITLEDPSTPVEAVAPVAEELKPRRKSTKKRPPISKPFSVWMPSSDVEYSDESDEDDSSIDDKTISPPGSPPSPQRPQSHRRVSSVPSTDLPSIPRQRKSSQPTTPTSNTEMEAENSRNGVMSAPSKLQKKSRASKAEAEDKEPPPPPPHTTTPSLTGSKTPVFVPSLPAFKTKRRSSSPLKHEYEPSTCTESSSETSEEEISEEEVDEEDQESLTSDSSEDELEDDVPMPLMPIGYPGPRYYASRPYSAGRDSRRSSATTPNQPDQNESPRISTPESMYTLPNGTITPSQSASNTPYRTVPHDSGKASKTIASIFAWSEAGRWDSLHPEECSIVVTPGKIEVFEITSSHSKPFLADGDEIIQTEGRAPLVAVELTPLVPLRKSTAIDISIRSPPTAESRIKTGNNIMLRSRNAQECAQLYAMINHSRINNPTYMALQNARGPYGQTSWAEVMDRQNAARTNAGSSSGWLGGTLGRRSSYRKKSTRAASISAATESSVGTMNSALRSALGRFSFAKHGMFSVRDSTLGSRSTGSSFDSGSNSNPGSGTTTPRGDGKAPGAPAGITNTKCRLYERESLKKWRDMGGARLTIMLPSPQSSTPSSPTNSRQRAPGVRDHTQERRIVVTGKAKGEILLDVTLSETCFERVARSGIAVSVWEDSLDDDGHIGIAKTGGVMGARARIFMVQMKSERECAYCFSLLGKMRY